MAEPSSTRKRPTSITLPPQQYRDLKRLAERRLASVSQIVRELVQAGIERESRVGMRNR